MGSVCAAPRQTLQPQTGHCWAAGSGVPCGHGAAEQLFRERAWPSQGSRSPLCHASQSRGSSGDGGDTKRRNDGTWPALGLFTPSLSPLQLVVYHLLSPEGPTLWSGPGDVLAGPLPLATRTPAQKGGTGSCGAAVFPGQVATHLSGTGHG